MDKQEIIDTLRHLLGEANRMYMLYEEQAIPTSENDDIENMLVNAELAIRELELTR